MLYPIELWVRRNATSKRQARQNLFPPRRFGEADSTTSIGREKRSKIHEPTVGRGRVRQAVANRGTRECCDRGEDRGTTQAGKLPRMSCRTLSSSSRPTGNASRCGGQYYTELEPPGCESFLRPPPRLPPRARALLSSALSDPSPVNDRYGGLFRPPPCERRLVHPGGLEPPTF